MSQYHKINLGEGYMVRDVPNPPFSKKVRIATFQLKDIILENLNHNRNIEYLKYINKRIHFFVEPYVMDLTDEEISDYIQKNLYKIRNDINI